MNKNFKKFNLVKFRSVLITAFITIISFAITGQSLASVASVTKVAVCPLEINASQDLTFLQRGLFTMLYSRLTDPGKVEVLDREIIDKALANADNSPDLKGALNETKAKAIGAGLGVDYILFGSMTQFGNSVSLDLSMINIKGEKPSLVFSKQASEPGAVITEMDKMATKINLEIFNRKPEVFISGDQTDQVPYAANPYATQSPYAATQFASPLSNYRHIFTTKGIINGIACGDTNGNKQTEVVIIYEHSIEVLQPDREGRLIRQAIIEDANYMNIISLDIADINGNGLAEIFVTRISPRTGGLESFVLEYTSGTYKKIAENLPWHFRVINDLNDNKVLFAQKYDKKKGPYLGKNVFRVHWENNAYVSGEKIRVPDEFNIMSFATDNLSGTGKQNSIFTNMSGNLKLFTENGHVEWSGDGLYGGTQLFYTFVEKDESLSPKFSEGRGVYFQPRNLFININKDEQTQVLVIRNKEATDSFLRHFRKFTSAYIEVLNLTEMGISSDMPAKKLPGQVTDFMIWNPDNGPQKELWITMVKDRNTFSSSRSTSLIVAYEL